MFCESCPCEAFFTNKHFLIKKKKKSLKVGQCKRALFLSCFTCNTQPVVMCLSQELNALKACGSLRVTEERVREEHLHFINYSMFLFHKSHMNCTFPLPAEKNTSSVYARSAHKAALTQRHQFSKMQININVQLHNTASLSYTHKS